MERGGCPFEAVSNPHVLRDHENMRNTFLRFIFGPSPYAMAVPTLLCTYLVLPLSLISSKITTQESCSDWLSCYIEQNGSSKITFQILSEHKGTSYTHIFQQKVLNSVPFPKGCFYTISLVPVFELLGTKMTNISYLLSDGSLWLFRTFNPKFLHESEKYWVLVTVILS